MFSKTFYNLSLNSGLSGKKQRPNNKRFKLKSPFAAPTPMEMLKCTDSNFTINLKSMENSVKIAKDYYLLDPSVSCRQIKINSKSGKISTKGRSY